MNSMDDSTEEEIHIDPKLMNEAFQRGLRQGKLSYLNQLKSRALVDYELQDDEALIGKAFELMRKFIGTQGTHVNHLSLRDWEEFGLSKHVINRLGYIAFQLDSASPVSKPTRRGFNRVPSSKNSDEVYDDDFEELEEIEEDNGLHSTVSTVRNNYSHVEDTNISTDFGISDSVRSGDSKRGEDDDDIVDETIQYSIHKPALKVTSSTAAAKPLRPRSSVEPVSSKFEMEIVPADPDDDVAKRAFTAGAQRRGKTATWIVNNEWRMGDKIGSGSFGEVYQGMNDRGQLFAVKKMTVEKNKESDDLLCEIQLMRGLSHPHIVEYLGASVDSANGLIYIFQEWVPGGSVDGLLKKFGAFPLGVIRNYTKQILLGLQYLHENGIIHRDIKGGNILVHDNGTVKLADFGASTRLSFDKTQETTTIKGTPYFMAPEVLPNSKYGRKGDIWAVGCTMIQMLTSSPPWKDRNLKGLVQLHLLLSSWNEGPPPHNRDITPDAQQCLEMCFRKNELDRPTAKELLQCKFLREEDMEDSYGSLNNTGGIGLDDSGVMTSLKKEMAIAVSRSSLALHGKGDIEDEIQQKLNIRNQQNDISPMYSTADRKDADDEILSKWADNAPSRNRYQPIVSKTPPRIVSKKNTETNRKSISNPSTPVMPKYSSDITESPNGKLAPVQTKSNNPFARGSKSLKPSPRADSAESGSDTPRSRLSAISEGRDHTKSETALPNVESQHDPRASLIMLKKKTVNYKQRGNSASSGRLGSATRMYRNNSESIDQSTNRDSEDLTPLPGDSSDTDDRYTVREAEHKEQRLGEEKRTNRYDSYDMDDTFVRYRKEEKDTEQDFEMEDSNDETELIVHKEVVHEHGKLHRHDEHTGRNRIGAGYTNSRDQPRGLSRGSQAASADAIGLVNRRPHGSLLPKVTNRFADDEGDSDFWICLKCKVENTNPEHCDYCATKRGKDGRRGVGAYIRYN